MRRAGAVPAFFELAEIMPVKLELRDPGVVAFMVTFQDCAMAAKDETRDCRETMDTAAASNLFPETTPSLFQTKLGTKGAVSLPTGECERHGTARDQAAARYSMIGEIARGGMGAIVKVVDNDIRRPVAMKVILGGADQVRLDRFIEEAQVTGQLEHPNIVPVHELGVDSAGKVFFTMKLVRGESLETIVDMVAEGDEETARTYTLSRFIEIFLKICEGVSFAHSKGVIHRDLKPENVMIGRFGEVMVMDWGLARIIDRRDDAGDGRPKPVSGVRPGLAPSASRGAKKVDSSRSRGGASRTLEGDVMGTPAYMPPEQANGRVDEIDERTDVFALGAILYKILTHDAPYAGDTVEKVLFKAARGDVIPPSKKAAWLRIPPELNSICMKAMQTDRDARYGSADELAEDLRAFMDRRLVSAHRYGLAAKIARFVQRHPTGSIAAGVALFMLALGGAVTGSLLGQLQASDARAKMATARRLAAEREREKAEVEEALAKEKARTAEVERDTVKTTLDKSRSVAKVVRLAREELSQLLSEMKARYHSGNSDGDLEVINRQVERVNNFLTLADSDTASQSTALAIAGWFRLFTHQGQEAAELFNKSMQTDPDVVYGPLLLAVSELSKCLVSERMPFIRTSDTGLSFERDPYENPVLLKARRNFRVAMDLVGRSRVWGECSEKDVASVLEALGALKDLDAAKAEKGLTIALGMPELWLIPEELLYARARARLLQGNLGGALSDALKVKASLPGGPAFSMLVGTIWTTMAADRALKGEDPSESYRQAIAVLGEITALHPGNGQALMGKASAGADLALYEEIKLGIDPRPALLRAIEELDRALMNNVDEADCLNNLGLLYEDLERANVERGVEDDESFEKALRMMSKAAELAPESWSHQANKAGYLMILGRYEEALECYSKAVDIGGAQAEAKLKKDIEAAEYAASGGGWVRTINFAGSFVRRSNYFKARKFFAESVKEAYEAGADKSDFHAKYVGYGRVMLAFFDFLWSVGKRGPKAELRPPPEDEAKSLRDSGIRHLAAALELGFYEWKNIEDEEDLAAIRSTKEYRDLAKRREELSKGG